MDHATSTSPFLTESPNLFLAESPNLFSVESPNIFPVGPPADASQAWPTADQQPQHEISARNFPANAPTLAGPSDTLAMEIWAPNAASTRQRKRKSPRKREEDWAVVKQRIIELYSTNSLSFVMDDVKKNFGFEATERQFKSQIRKWGLNKNVQRNEMEFIVHKQQTRVMRQAVDPSQADLRFTVRRRVVSQAKINRWKQNHDVTSAASGSVDTPSDVSYSTVSEGGSTISTPAGITYSPAATPVIADGDSGSLTTGRRDFTSLLGRIRDCIDCGDVTTTQVILADILKSIRHRPDDSLVRGVFGDQTLSRDEVESKFTKIISLREEQFGVDDVLTTQARANFVDIMLTMLTLDNEDKRWDQDYAARILELSRDLLHQILSTKLSEELVQKIFRAVRRPSDEPAQPDLVGDPWKDYNFVETLVTACAKYPYIYQAFISSTEYGELLFISEVGAAFQLLVRDGMLTEIIDEDGRTYYRLTERGILRAENLQPERINPDHYYAE